MNHSVNINRRILNSSHILAYILMIFSLSGCSTLPVLFSTKISAQFIAADDMNPDAQGRASPVVIRYYELKAGESFNNADFFPLYDQEEATLGGDLISREEFELAPAKIRKVDKKLNDETKLFGVVAAFRNINMAQWHTVTMLKPHQTNSMIIQIGKETITIHKQ